MIRFVATLCLVYALGVCSHTYYLYTHREFGPKDFCHGLVLHRPCSSPSNAARHKAQEILQQKFTYLGCGGQMTAYESEDNRYVLKFFNPRSTLQERWFHRMQKLIRINSWKWISNTYFHQKERLEKYFHRYELSYHDLKEETALVYIHVDPGSALPGNVEVVDKEGTHHHLKLETHPFVLQKKAQNTMTYLSHLKEAGKIEEAKEATRQIYLLFETRAKKGYTDQHQAIDGNFGFIKGQFVQFDPGRIRKNQAIAYDPHPELKRVIGNIKHDLSNYPELVQVLEECLDRKESSPAAAQGG